MEKQMYIVRSRGAGVFFAEIVSRNGNEVELANARRLYYWDGAASLSQLAMEGVKNPNKCRFTMAVNSCIVMEVVEIIPCSSSAVENINAVPIWKI
jgi:hypothetical protein